MTTVIDITPKKEIDRRSFDKLFRMHYKPLCLFALKYVQDYDEAEELVQNTFVKILENWGNQKFHTSQHSYLFQAVKNACFNLSKHLKVKQEYMNHNERERQKEEMIMLTGENEKDKMTQVLLQEIEQLPEQCQKIFRMSKLDGMKYQEIANQLDLSVKAIENQMGKALKVIREK